MAKAFTMDIFKLINNKIPSNIKTCFLSGIIIGWATHFYMLTNKIPNWDDISQINSLGLTTGIGRWMLEPLRDIGQRASNPAIHGLLLVVFITLAACLVVSSLNLKSTTSAVLVPAVMVTFPSVTGVMFFMFTAHLYGIGILLFALSGYFIQKYKFGFIPSGICIVLALAIYQPFVSVVIAIFLLELIFSAIRGEKFKKLVRQGFIDAGTLAVSTLIWAIIAHLINPNMSQETYGGVNEMGKISISEAPRLLGRVYKRVLEYFVSKPFAFVTPTMRWLNIMTCIGIVVLLVACIIKFGIVKRKLELAFMGIMCFLFPFAIGFIYFMAPQAPFSTLMLYAYCMVYVLIISLAEMLFANIEIPKEIGSAIRKPELYGAFITAAVISLVVYNNYLLDSQAYFRSSIAFERTVNYYNRIVQSVESQNGFKNGDRVAILGEFYYLDNPAPIELYVFYDDINLRELSGVALENGLITSGVRNNFIKTYIGFDGGKISTEEKQSILDSTEYKEMQLYPSSEGISKIGDIWVVKLCE